MKYVVIYLLTVAFFLVVYYVAFAIAAIASMLTDGQSNYAILLVLAGISGLVGPYVHYSDKNL